MVGRDRREDMHRAKVISWPIRIFFGVSGDTEDLFSCVHGEIIVREG